jgi:anti-sigma regulatory factor (Ser/Thr protein kinase)
MCGRLAAAAPGREGVNAETALLGILAIPGRPEFARAARLFVARMVGGRYAWADTAVLLSSELVGNSLQYSDSTHPGGVITVALLALPDGVRIEVTDAGGATVPTLCAPAPRAPELAEGGRGLQLVDLLSARWDYDRAGARLTTWFELASLAP